MHKFIKAEKLCNKVDSDILFSNGKSFFLEPFRIVFLKKDFDTNHCSRIQIVVPKRNISKAVDRNKIKRFIREAYRKNKKSLIDNLEFHKTVIDFSLIYQIDEIKSFSFIEEKIKAILLSLMLK
jgi:ribonuclease P protein component|tara:strand:+ start:57539 stop:57910 length:372 start_codon:yes stop_codon:yes gene_type:complete